MNKEAKDDVGNYQDEMSKGVRNINEDESVEDQND